MRQQFGNRQKANTLVLQTSTPVFEWLSISDENLPVRKMAKHTTVCVDLAKQNLKSS